MLNVLWPSLFKLIQWSIIAYYFYKLRNLIFFIDEFVSNHLKYLVHAHIKNKTDLLVICNTDFNTFCMQALTIPYHLTGYILNPFQYNITKYIRITITLADTRCQNAPTLPVKVTGVKSPSRFKFFFVCGSDVN